jgi:hypothetical protein
MVLESLIQSSPFITGISLEVAFMIGLFILRTPIELAILVLIPVNVIVIGFYVPAIIPLIGLVAGILIGFAFLRIIRR